MRVALAGLIPAAVDHVLRHKAPTGPVFAVVIFLTLLYVAWRTGRLKGLRSTASALRTRGALEGVKVRPLALLPTLLLVIVVVVLLIAH